MKIEDAARPAIVVRETAGAGVLPSGRAATHPGADRQGAVGPSGAAAQPGAAPTGPRPGTADLHIGAAAHTGSGGRPMEDGILREGAGGWYSSDW